MTQRGTMSTLFLLGWEGTLRAVLLTRWNYSGQQGGNGASKESPPMKKGKQGTKRTAGDYLEEDDDEDEDDEETVPFRKKPRVKSACKGGKRQQTGVEKEDEDEEGFTVKPEPGYGGYGEDDDEKGPWADPDLDVSLDQY